MLILLFYLCQLKYKKTFEDRLELIIDIFKARKKASDERLKDTMALNRFAPSSV